MPKVREIDHFVEVAEKYLAQEAAELGKEGFANYKDFDNPQKLMRSLAPDK